MPVIPDTAAALSLLSADAVRQRAHRMLAMGLEDRLAHFRIDLARLEEVADRVAEITRKAYPDLEVLFHSRWRHFVVGGEDRWAAVDTATRWRDDRERVASRVDPEWHPGATRTHMFSRSRNWQVLDVARPTARFSRGAESDGARGSGR